MARLFGTDGVRGLANQTVTAELAVSLAGAAVQELAAHSSFSDGRPTAIVGRDTRISGEFLSAAVSAGLAAAGVDVIDVGVLPTPAVAYLTGKTKADLGVMISASHNPMPDNGIKFFARGGTKLPDALEEAIEARLGTSWDRPIGPSVGRITVNTELAAAYVDHVLAAVLDFSGQAQPLSGLHLVVDGAHGAASLVGPAALERAGARVSAINCAPNGLNINDGVGSTHIEVLAAAVVSSGADLGFAWDGDADRCLAVDAAGHVISGDHLMGMLAIAMHQQERLYRDTLVATVMSNFGLHQAMRAHGIDIVETAVGDRYVLETMTESGFSLGGEQSGHIIVADYASTGDGILTALLVAAQVAQAGPLRELCSVISMLPQVLVNVPNVDLSRVQTDLELQAEVSRVRKELGDSGRVLLRPSGTEPIVRVMVEAETDIAAQTYADRLAQVVKDRLSLS